MRPCSRLALLAALVASSCSEGGEGEPESDAATGCSDRDGDGWGAGPGCQGDDCDEWNPARHDGCGEDCDAVPDDVGCPCDAAQPAACFDADPTLAGVGRCKPGLRDCTQGVWGPCEGQVLPDLESSHGDNDVDDDCNGDVDDRLCGDEPDCGGRCCAPGEVCLGAFCGDPPDCAVDGNCDNDTHCSVDGCIPYEPGETNVDCTGEIVDPVEPIGEFVPDIQCEWAPDDGGPSDVIVPPLVIDLDPSIDDAVHPEVVFLAFDGFSDLRGTLVAIDGETCDERWRSEGGPALDGCAPIAVGDLENDGSVEIAVHRAEGGIAVFDPTGELLWENDAPDTHQPCEVCACLASSLFANLDGVGDAEVMMGLAAYDSTGEEIWRLDGEELAPWGNLPVVADVDLDGRQEVVTGTLILDGADGSVEARFDDLENGLPGVADFDKSTPEPEIAVIAPDGARIQRIDGTVVFGPNPALVAGFYGGPPVIADFDGDGEAEFGSASAQAYVVFDPDCEPGWDRAGECLSGRDDGILWEKATQDFTSGSTGSSVFDFDADGVSEVVYNDECFTRVYDGITGETRFIHSNSTGTGFEFPVIADVDGDRKTEIVVAANAVAPECPDDAETGEPWEGFNAGVRIWRDVEDRWAPSRRVWNQHAYSVTNVREDGRIPEVPEDNWAVAGLNNFRVNTEDDPTVTERGVDLTVRGGEWTDSCPELIRLTAVVANRGVRRAPRGLAVGFTVDDPAGGEPLPVCETRTETDLEPGETEEVSCDWLEPSGARVDVHVHVDDDGVVTECEEENNDARIPDVDCGIE